MRKGILLAALCLTAMPALANENPRSDLNGDGRADLVWRHVERGTNVAWLDGNHATPVGLSAEPGVHWYIAAIGDFDGDGRSDLAWRTDGTSEQATREMHIWPGGVAHDAYAYEVPLFLGIVAVGDFNGDGLDDLFQRHVVDGGVASYLTLCVADRPACYDESSTVSDDWQVAGAGDFDGDGSDDLLWRHQELGHNVLWYSASAELTKTLAREPKMAWHVVAVGDFDGNGRDDLLWRNDDNGMLAAWPHGEASLAMPVARLADPAWQLVATADYNGDGEDDLVWRNQASGANAMWLSADPRTPQPMAGVPDLRWRAVGGEDDDGQGGRL